MSEVLLPDDPAVVAVFNTKGGVGKSTLTVHLAVEACMLGLKVCILDLDSQGSATAWRRTRVNPIPTVVQVPAVSLDYAIAGAVADGYDLILLDSPPSVSPATARILTAAKLVVIPVRPEPFDVAAIQDTLNLVGVKRVMFVLSDCPSKAPEIAETRGMLENLGYPVLGPINNRRSMWRALVSGQAISEFEPKGKPAAEVAEVCQSILKAIGVSHV